MDEVVREAIAKVEQTGIVFLDEIDKIAGRERTMGPDVSREGVQRDLLPIVEGSTVSTKHGAVRTDHILFIAAGAFHVAKPSDLIPELQGRFPIRVELAPLSEEDFVRILTEPHGALVRQYHALMETEGLRLRSPKMDWRRSRRRPCRSTSARKTSARAVCSRLWNGCSSRCRSREPEMEPKHIVVDAGYVRERLQNIVKDQDLSRYIL